MKRTVLFIAQIAALLVSVSAGEEVIRQRIDSKDADFSLVRLAAGIPNPWSFAFLPGGDVLITQRSGRLWRLNGEGEKAEVGGLPEVLAGGQGGLLDILLHPEYTRNGWLYLSHSVSTASGGATAVSRARLAGNRLVDTERIFTANNGGRTTRHFGSRLAFDDDGYLYVTLGDRGEDARAQDTTDHAGSTLRLFDDGSTPPDNPFAADSSGAEEIYSWGHRNAQGMVFDPVTGSIWLNEHGAKGGDEVNIVRKGANYGWPVISYGTHYSGAGIGVGTSAPGMVQPELYWDPSIAPSGMEVYTGDAFPGWRGDLFVGALRAQHLRRLARKGGEIVEQEVLLQGLIGRIRDVGQGPDGLLYLLTDERNGGFYRLEPPLD
jgi:aldose sugar dehydrogenase